MSHVTHTLNKLCHAVHHTQLNSLPSDNFDNKLIAVQHNELDNDSDGDSDGDSNDSAWEMDSAGLQWPHNDQNSGTELDGIEPYDFGVDCFSGFYERDEEWEDEEDAWQGADDLQEELDNTVELSLPSHCMGSSSKENNQNPMQVTPSTPPPVMEGYEIEYFPGKEAAAPLNTANHNPYAPFASKLDWELAKWAKLCGPSSSAFNELLRIEGIADGLAYKNTQELNMLIDQKLPHRPLFHCHDIWIGAIYRNPEFAAHLIHLPECHFQHSGEECVWVFHDMHTGSWWWKVQEVVKGYQPGTFVVPIALASDRTHITQFGNKTAYPVYMMIGNLPKEIRCKSSHSGQILLAYLPTTKLKLVTNKAAQHRMLNNLFHSCLHHILQPLVDSGIHGIAMSDGLGNVHHVHPILAIYIGDYPEQVMVTGIKTGECPKCDIPNKELGNEQLPSKVRGIHTVLNALHKFGTSDH
ncbi:hypothetical protein APHAL10511_005769 [Amanita phalloides]|nr:hypothetical protein APHAL10511_005769 [Amanita phalloides]